MYRFVLLLFILTACDPDRTFAEIPPDAGVPDATTPDAGRDLEGTYRIYGPLVGNFSEAIGCYPTDHIDFPVTYGQGYTDIPSIPCFFESYPDGWLMECQNQFCFAIFDFCAWFTQTTTLWVDHRTQYGDFYWKTEIPGYPIGCTWYYQVMAQEI